MNQYLIAANTKKGQLIFNIFRPVDLIIAICGAVVTFILFFIFQPDSLGVGLVVLFPVLFCAFLVMPIPNYHNVLCVIQNIWRFYFKDNNEMVWKGWCAKDEYKD